MSQRLQPVISVRILNSMHVVFADSVCAMHGCANFHLASESADIATDVAA